MIVHYCFCWFSCVDTHDHHYVQNGFTALHDAAREGHLRVAEMLLEANADMNSKTNVCKSYDSTYTTEGRVGLILAVNHFVLVVIRVTNSSNALLCVWVKHNLV